MYQANGAPVLGRFRKFPGAAPYYLASPLDKTNHLWWAEPVDQATGTGVPCPKGCSRFHGNNWNQKYYRAVSARWNPPGGGSGGMERFEEPQLQIISGIQSQIDLGLNPDSDSY